MNEEKIFGDAADLAPQQDAADLAPQQDAREVVLRYEQPCVPVVERYVQPCALPGKRPPETVPETRKRSRRGLKIFFVCLTFVLLAAAVIAVLVATGVLHVGGNSGADAPSRSDPLAAAQSGTTIPAYPNGDGTRLRYSETHDEELPIQQIYEKLNPSTVTVMTALPSGSAMVGTGVIFTENGYILTNAHVIVGGAECYVVLDNGVSYEAKLVGFDEVKDLAVIKVDGHGLPAAEFGDSDTLSVGDTVYAIGNPLGVNLRGTLTDGIVSAINRDVYVDGVTMTLIQTNAALNNGNSGGPLINIYGQVVGINTMKMGSTSTTSVEGLGFAIPISSTAYMINNLIDYGEIHGEVVIGITVSSVPVTLPDGVQALEVIDVTKGSPADEAGIAKGDFLLSADGETLTASLDLIRIRRRHEAGETLRLGVLRGEKRFSADVVLRESEQ